MTTTEMVLFTARRKPGETVQRWVSPKEGERLKALYEQKGYRVNLTTL